MYGPKPAGAWISLARGNRVQRHQFLETRKHYRVLREFVDFDKGVHPAGEQWEFLGFSFSPYEDGMSFFVSLDGVQEWHIRLQWRPEGQAEILDHLANYVAEAGV